MRPFFIFLLSVTLFFSAMSLCAQEITDSLQVQSDDSSLMNREIGESSYEYDYFSDSLRVFYSIIILVVSFVLSIYLRQPLQRLSEHKTRYSRIIKQIVPLLLLISWFLVIYFIITQILELTYISNLSLFVLIGFALALAFQDVLRDIIAGLIVPFENHIEKGNKVRIGGTYGEIIKTGFRETLLKAPDGSTVVLPNSQIIKKTVISVSADHDNCPVEVDFYLPTSADLDQFRKIAHKSAIISPYLFLNKSVTVHFSNELTSGQPIIKMRVKAHLRKIEFQSLFISELTETVLKEIGRATNMTDLR